MVLAGAILMENTRWLSNDTINEQQVGDLSQFEGGSIRGFRAGLGGTFNFKKPWTYVFSFGTQAFERGFEQGDLDEFVLYDYRVDIPVGTATLSVGNNGKLFLFKIDWLGIYAQSTGACIRGGWPFTFQKHWDRISIIPT